MDWNIKLDVTKYKGQFLPMMPSFADGAECAVDESLSAAEAAAVANTWHITIQDWIDKAANAASTPGLATGSSRRYAAVYNCGYTSRHGINPSMHSPVVDLE
jgi:hypothetical protein